MLHSRLQEWRNRRANAAASVVDSELASSWHNVVIGNEVTAAYVELERLASSPVKLAILNVASPSLMRSETIKFVYDLLGALVNQSESDNMGLTIGPIHTTARGQVLQSAN